MIAVESIPQKGTLRIHQPALPHQLEKPSQARMETISWRFTVLRGGRPGKVPGSHTEHTFRRGGVRVLLMQHHIPTWKRPPRTAPPAPIVTSTTMVETANESYQGQERGLLKDAEV